MKVKTTSRLPRLIRSIFLPRKSAAVMKELPVSDRILSIDNDAAVSSQDQSVAVVLREVIDTQALVAALRSTNADGARDAAVQLGLSGDAAAVEPLIDVLNNHNWFFHTVVRNAAATSLGQLKDQRAVDALIAATGDGTAEISEEAARALGSIGDTRAIEPLLNIVANRSGFYLQPVRRTAVKALSQFRDARVASVLLAVAVNEDEDEDVREEARSVRVAN